VREKARRGGEAGPLQTFLEKKENLWTVRTHVLPEKGEPSSQEHRRNHLSGEEKWRGGHCEEYF